MAVIEEMMKVEAERLANAHWGYVQSILDTHGELAQIIEKIGFHYRAALIHGFGHGVEWERNRSYKIEEDDGK